MPKIVSKKKSKITRSIPTGRVYIQASYNNTMVTVTDTTGNVISWSSAGKVGFRGPKKATPYAASVIVKDALTRAKEAGMEECMIFVNGVGSGREGAIRAVNTQGVNILGIKDITPIPHNGCRPPGARRV